MKTTIEYHGRPLTLPAKAPAGSLLTICAWCDPEKTLAQSLIAQGYRLTHGVCEKHKAEFGKKMNYNQ